MGDVMCDILLISSLLLVFKDITLVRIFLPSPQYSLVKALEVYPAS